MALGKNPNHESVTDRFYGFLFKEHSFPHALLVVKGVAMVAPLTLISDSKLVFIVFLFSFLLSIVKLSLMTMLKHCRLYHQNGPIFILHTYTFK